ncbi:MAG TPA: replication-relaxation family protein [Solirubrobacterales bacterium]|nr:replication-relaxation family protein [Solirubrobacterales bacterium]
MNAAAPRRRGLPAQAIEIVASVAQHRALSAEQIRKIHMPGVRERWAQRVLARIGRAGLLAHAQTTSVPQRLWFVTELGLRAAKEQEALEGKPRLFSADEVVGPLQAHTVAVNEAGICFLKTARERGDEFGPLSWRHEVPHPLGPGDRHRRRTLFADAVLTYLRLTDEQVFVEQRFLELDRATMSVDSLAAELGRYALLYRAAGADGTPRWKSRYPSFPPVLCVLTGAGRDVLERRRATAIALMRSNPDLSRAPKLSIRICLADELVERGPFEPIFTDYRDPELLTDWLVEEPRA